MGATDTNTKVANRALNAIGNTTVLTDLETDASTQAKIVRRVYQDCVDAVLQEVDWNFNARRVALPALDVRPVFDFAYQYALPADCLKVRDVYDSGAGTAIATGYGDEFLFDRERWVVETVGDTDENMVRVIACDIGAPLNVLYSRRVEALSRWSPLAVEMLIARVSMLIAMPITQKQSIYDNARDSYMMIKGQAAGRDAQEGSATTLDSGSWVQARW